MYNYLIMISDTSDASLEGLKVKLDKFYSNSKNSINLSLSNSTITLKIDNYIFYVSLSSEEHVIAESKEISNKYASQRTDKDIIGACKKRFEMYGLQDDFDMDYFNDSLFIIEKIEEFRGVYIFNPQDGTFLDDI